MFGWVLNAPQVFEDDDDNGEDVYDDDMLPEETQGFCDTSPPTNQIS